MITFVLICENYVLRRHLGYHRRMNRRHLGCCYRLRYSFHLRCCEKNCCLRSYRMNEKERKSYCGSSGSKSSKKSWILSMNSMSYLCVQSCRTNWLNESVD